MRQLRLTLAILLLAFVGGCGKLKIEHEPRFTCNKLSYPAARDNYPPLVAPNAWGQRAVPNPPPPISGFDFMTTFRDDVPSDQFAVQILTITGTDSICGQPPVDLGEAHIEYFASPPHDLVANFITYESRHDETREMFAAFVQLPGTRPPIQPPHHAAELDANYFNSPGAPALRVLMDEIQDQARVNWRLHWDYDGCHPPPHVPETNCHEAHCLDITYRGRSDPADSYGDWKTKHYSSNECRPQ